MSPLCPQVDEVRNWKLLGETDPRMVISPTARRGHTMVKIDANYALVFGGALGKGFQYSSQLFRFNFQTKYVELFCIETDREHLHTTVLFEICNVSSNACVVAANLSW